MKIRGLLCIILLFSLCNDSLGQKYIFAQLTGTPMNTSGWTMHGGAYVGNISGVADSELIVCPLTPSNTGVGQKRGSSGSVFYNQPINLSRCNKWIAEFDFRMYDGDGADGLAFCFLDVPPAGYVIGGGLGVPTTANGLKICFDTWNNCNVSSQGSEHTDMPKIEIRWRTGYHECPTVEPTRENRNGDISFIRSADYQHAKVTYDAGNINVYVNGQLYVSGFQTFDFTGYLGFTASTGGSNDNHSIKNVIIYTDMPPSVAGNTQSFCPQDTIQIGSPDHPDYVYSWTPITGLNNATLAAPLLHITANPTNDSLLKYYVHTAFKNNPGCSSVDSVQIKVYSNPKVDFIEPKICATDGIAQFQDSSYSSDSTMMPFTYQWNFGDPDADAQNPNSSFAKNPSHHYSAAGHYPLKLVVTSSTGCTDSLTKTFTVNGTTPKSSFSIPHAPALCSNQPVGILNESSVDFGSISKVQIFWGDSSTVSYTDDNPSPGKPYFHLYPNPVTSHVTDYTIRMISFSGTHCENESDQTIHLQPSPHIQFAAVPSLCTYDEPVQINEMTELTGLAGSFSFSGEGITNDGIFNPKLTGAGTFSILCQYASPNGCVDTVRQTITVLKPPSVFAGNDTTVVANQPLQLKATTTENLLTYQWSPATGLDNADISNPVSVLGSNTDSIKYIAKATDTAGCHGESSITIKVFKTAPDIFVPNAFTPTSSINNIFRPITVGISSIQFFRIYNRWGQLIYSTSGIGGGWDGTFSGKLQETGTYVWMVQATTYTGATISRQGTVVLIR